MPFNLDAIGVYNTVLSHLKVVIPAIVRYHYIIYNNTCNSCAVREQCACILQNGRGRLLNNSSLVHSSLVLQHSFSFVRPRDLSSDELICPCHWNYHNRSSSEFNTLEHDIWLIEISYKKKLMPYTPDNMIGPGGLDQGLDGKNIRRRPQILNICFLTYYF